MRVKIIVLALALSACGEPPQKSSAPPPASPAAEPPAPAPAPLSIRDNLVDCAGAIAAEGNVDPLVDPSTGTPAENALWTVLALMDKEPGLAGQAGREAAAEAKTRWLAKPAAERTARSSACVKQFGG